MLFPTIDALQTTTVDAAGLESNRIESTLHTDRPRLVRLCRTLTGDRDLAEDLAQETMLIGWRAQHTLRVPEKRAQWLDGIARNLCRMWVRQQQRARKHLAGTISTDSADWHEEAHAPVAACDLDQELERQEFATLLDRAMTQLPPLTRTVLTERYIHNMPQAEVAHTLNISEGAVESRIQRGKLTMRRVLTTDMVEDAAALGLLVSPNTEWQRTNIKCMSCGERKMMGCFPHGEKRIFGLTCPCGCNICFNDTIGLFDGIRGYRPAFNRLTKHNHKFLQQGLTHGHVSCRQCSQPVQIHCAATPELPAELRHAPPALPNSYGVWMHCHACDWMHQFDIAAIAVTFPQFRTFTRAHKCVHTLPHQLIEAAGTPALLVSFEAAGSAAQLDLLFDRATLTLLPNQPHRDGS